MAAPDTQEQKRDRALLSVYYHGRKGGAALRGQAVSTPMLQLGDAISALLDPVEKNPVRWIRLALADLCRTRAAGPNAEADQAIAQLATALSQRIDPPRPPAELVRSFAAIFPPRRSIKPETAYKEAMLLMVKLIPPPPAGVASPTLESYTVNSK
jgi:hypothetical protein